MEVATKEGRAMSGKPNKFTATIAKGSAKSGALMKPEPVADAVKKDTIYFHGTNMGKIVADLCRDRGIKKQDLYWYGLNLALQDYGVDPVARPEDKRRRGSKEE